MRTAGAEALASLELWLGRTVGPLLTCEKGQYSCIALTSRHSDRLGQLGDKCVLQQGRSYFTSTAGKGIDKCVLQQRRGISTGLARSVSSISTATQTRRVRKTNHKRRSSPRRKGTAAR